MRLAQKSTTMNAILPQLREALNELGSNEVRQSTLRFFREPIQCYGLKSAEVNKLGREVWKSVAHLSKAEIFALCGQLWQSGMLEESFVACQWSHKLSKQYQPADFDTFAGWISQYITNWASCDTFCNHTMGDLLMKYPQFLTPLKTFSQSTNRWVRRAAAVSLIVPARKGLFLDDIFDIANRLLTDPDDMVQKGYGWMLKVASAPHLPEVFEYVCQHKAAMPRTALRYAIEKMPEDMRQQAMAK